MADAEHIELMREAARRHLARYPEALSLTSRELVAADVVREAIDLAVEQGWFALRVPEESGGLGLGMMEATIVAREVGRTLAPGPFMANIVIVPALCRLSDEREFAALQEGLLEGRTFATIAVRKTDAERALVEHAESTTDLLQILQPNRSTATAISLTKLRPGWVKQRAPFDPSAPLHEIEGGVDHGRTLSLLSEQAGRDLFAEIYLWLAAEGLGVSERAGELSIEHATRRNQFGQAIGSYQAIKHRIVDDYVARENAVALLEEATLAYDSSREDRNERAIGAYAAAIDAAYSATSHCVQVHGAIGFSWEHPAHLYYKRARKIGAMMGDALSARAALGDSIFKSGAEVAA